MNELLENLSKEAKSRLTRKGQPDWTSPMLAVLSPKIVSGKEWIYERKLDGERCLVFKKGKKITLLSRNKKELNVSYPEIVSAIQKQLTPDFIIDGEIVAFDGNITSFSMLQNRMNLQDPQKVKASKTKVYYYVFDVIYFDGYDLSGVGLTDRKKVLKGMFNYTDPFRFTGHKNEKGEQYFPEACKKGWEGLIAKKAGSEYVHHRSPDWLKLKCVNQQEFVIGGYTDPEGERLGFGALLIGFYKNGNLQYAGKVGTGYNTETLKDLYGKLHAIEKNDPEFAREKTLPSKKVHWVKAKYVAEIGFTEWTESNKLRHPRYLGLRDDKNPEDVVQEK